MKGVAALLRATIEQPSEVSNEQLLVLAQALDAAAAHLEGAAEARQGA
ncbi:MAG: hypothetical protein Q4E12_03705 [Coriobacteriia bacterium]|nr:hypothetical protein [Coriobacteriia bacterium]